MVSTWVKLHRKIADNPIMRHPVALQVLIWCMVKVQWKPYRWPTRWGAVDLQPGEVVIWRGKLAESLNTTERKIRTALQLLTKEKILTSKTTNTHTIITLVNFEQLQGQEYETTTETTSTRPALDQHSTLEQEGLNLSIQEINQKPIAAAKAARKPKATAPGFEEFWGAYPKRRGRGAALAQWNSLKPDLQVCLNTLRWQRVDVEWTKDNGKWIPWPQKWIKEQRWLDEKESGRGTGRGDGWAPTTGGEEF
jgi:hypothetical protein